eukprot:Gb_28437 [translate_table: standard]
MELILSIIRIIYYKEDSCSSDDDAYNYYKYCHDIQWIRTIDFTQSCSIGQSSSICLELPSDINISQVIENFAHYKEIEEKLSLDYGPSFSCTLKLVPIVNPPEGLQFPYKILFKINNLVQCGILIGPSLGKEFFSLLQDERRPPAHINMALAKLSNSKSTCYEPIKWLQMEFNNFRKSERNPDSADISLDNGLMYVHRVQVTPSKVYFLGPEVNISNCVTRHYAEYIDDFLRVSFVDENSSRLWSSDLSKMTVNGGQGKPTKVYKRILSVLREGILIGNKKFEFLAFSSSQIREAIKIVAKCAIRMGQSLSSSTETLHVYEHEIEEIPDICVDSGGRKYISSDGIGKISVSLSEQVAAKCRCDKKIPSAFQIRYGGCKGVVAVDPTSSCKLSWRPSMQKYISKNTNLDVLSWAKFLPCFLNRQIIILLSTLGVEDQKFEMMQKEVVRDLDQLLNNQDMALEVVQIMSVGDNQNALIEMISCGYFPNSEPYLSMMLHAFRASKLLELRNKARIFVPKGGCLMGCLDETRTLNYGEVFIQVSHSPIKKRFHYAGISAITQNGLGHTTCIVEGKVIVAKNPCLHPGDVRILLAVNTPKLHHMVDCIVFPQQAYIDLLVLVN